MERFNPIPNHDYQKLRLILNYIAYRIGDKLVRNSTYDERGLTDELLDMLQLYFNQIKLSKYYISLNANKPSEKKTGADILFRVQIQRQEVSFDRYVLIQAKKYSVSSKQFSETNIGNTHLNSQVTRMQSYNPEFSYILLYSTSNEPIGNKVSHFNHYSEFDIKFQMLFEELITSAQPHISANMQGTYPVTLLRSKTWKNLTNNQSENLLSYSEILPNFLLDDLITGKIGKDWDEAIQNAQGKFSIVVTLSIGKG